MLGLFLFAQNQDPNSPVYDYNYTDSTQTTTDSSSTGTPSEGSEEMVKVYQRIVMPFDSATNLITYNGIVEQEESGSDSLYARAKRFAEKNLGKGKELYEMDKRNQKLVVNGSIPAFAYINKYNKAYDKVLRYADKDIKETIQKFQLAMREPKLADEDDW